MGKLNHHLFEVWVSCGFFNKRDLWKTKHRQTECWKLSWSTDGNDPKFKFVGFEEAHRKTMSFSLSQNRTFLFGKTENLKCWVRGLQLWVTWEAIKRLRTRSAKVTPQWRTAADLVRRRFIAWDLKLDSTGTWNPDASLSYLLSLWKPVKSVIKKERKNSRSSDGI